jgi:hypothetical protein
VAAFLFFANDEGAPYFEERDGLLVSIGFLPGMRNTRALYAAGDKDEVT